MPIDADSAVEVRDIRKWFGDKEVLSGITFSVPRGQIVGLLGPNGAGKTTTLRAIAGVLAVDDGRILVEGRDATKSKEAVRSIGYMPEHPPIYRELTVAGHLRFWAKLRDVRSSDVSENVEKAIASAGLEPVRNLLARKLSKGYRQRLGLAQTLVHEPSVLILDEPTAGLDPDQIVQTRGLISSLKASKTLLVSTHILPDVARMCDRVVIIRDGRIVGEGSGLEIAELERLYLDTVHSV